MDMSLLIFGVAASLTGIYFLVFPIGGYQGGRNPYYGIRILFERSTWDDLHTWTGVLMVLIAAIHITYHWSWFKNMGKKIYNEMIGRQSTMNWRGRLNLMLNILVGVGFLLAAISGIYFLFAPPQNAYASSHGTGIVEAIWLNRQVWDMIHTWSGVVFVSAVIVHVAIHWGWIYKVTRKLFAIPNDFLRKDQVPEAN
jgi:hypothetical protein